MVNKSTALSPKRLHTSTGLSNGPTAFPVFILFIAALASSLLTLCTFSCDATVPLFGLFLSKMKEDLFAETTKMKSIVHATVASKEGVWLQEC